MQRYAFIDAIRGIAACAVMLQHALYQSGLLGDFAHHATLTGFIPTRLELGETGVVAFFLVSGFVIPLSLEKTGSFKLFWLHRIFRIYPLYLFIYFLTFLVLAGGGLHSVSAILLNFSTHLFFVQEYLHQKGFVGGSWTLSLEMVWYIAMSCLFLISLNKSTGKAAVRFDPPASPLHARECGHPRLFPKAPVFRHESKSKSPGTKSKLG